MNKGIFVKGVYIEKRDTKYSHLLCNSCKHKGDSFQDHYWAGSYCKKHPDCKKLKEYPDIDNIIPIPKWCPKNK